VAAVEVLTDLGHGMWLQGDVPEALDRLTSARDRARALGDRVRTLRAELALTDVRSWVDPTWTPDEALPTLLDWMAELEELGDPHGLADGWSLVGRLHYDAGRSTAAVEALERAHAQSRSLGHRAGSQPPLIWLMLALMDGATPVRTALRRLERLAEEMHGDLHVECMLMNNTAILAAMDRDFVRARRLGESARSLSEQLGVFLTTVGCAQAAFLVAALEGRPGAAEVHLRPVDAMLEALGETSARSTVLAMLAHAQVDGDRLGEARRTAELARSMTQSDDLFSEVLWRTALALVESRLGGHQRADELASEAVGMMARTDQLSRHGDALLVRAEVRRRWGRTREATTDAEAALALYRQKGDLASADRAAAFLRSAAAAP
jgi:tetratricopeptide (TPR) repeat protein